MEEVLWLAVRLTAGLFAGACTYIALVQQPARMEVGGVPAIAEFRAVIPRAERLQLPLLLACLATGTTLFALSLSAQVLVGTVLLGLIVPFTVLWILPINRRLLSRSAGDHAGAAPALLAHWGALHLVRSGAALAGACVLLA